MPDLPGKPKTIVPTRDGEPIVRGYENFGKPEEKAEKPAKDKAVKPAENKSG